jgi:hypothetical protein
MSIARIAITPQTFERHTPAGEAVGIRGFWVRAWNWLIEVQMRRAEDVIRAHPEWGADQSVASESPGAHLQCRTSILIGY